MKNVNMSTLIFSKISWMITAVVFMLVAVLTSTGLLVHGHDTWGWMLPSRIWFVHTLRSGELPLWFDVPRYGFSTLNGQFVAGFWSPFALLVALFGEYKSSYMPLEFLTWRVVAFAGTYLLAKRHCRLTLTRLAIASSYVASGALGWAESLHWNYPAMAIVPWVIAGLDLAMADDFVSRNRGIAMTGFSYSCLLWFGYAGYFLTLPILIFPYFIIKLLRTKHYIVISTNIIKAYIIFLLISGPIICETFIGNIFGSNLRTNFSPREGLLKVHSVMFLMFANPSFIADIGNPLNVPGYIGIVPFIGSIIGAVSALRSTGRRFVVRFDAHFAEVASNAFTILILICIIFNYFTNDKIWWQVTLIIGILGILCLIFFSTEKNTFLENNSEYIFTILWVSLLSSEEIVSIPFRDNIFPFSILRFQYCQIYIIGLIIILYGWRVIEELFLSELAHRDRRNWSFIALAMMMIGLLHVVAAVMPPSDWQFHALGQVESFGLIRFAASIICDIFLIIITMSMICINKNTQENVQLTIVIATGFVATVWLIVKIYVEVTLQHGPPEVWWSAMMSLPKYGRLTLELAHIIAVFLSIGASKYIKNMKKRFIWIVFIGCLDPSLASVRYIGDTEIANVNASRVWTGDFWRPDGVRGDVQGSPDLVALASVAPHMWRFPGTYPALASVDESLGFPSVFQKFAWLPSFWWEDLEGGIHVDRLSLYGLGSATGIAFDGDAAIADGCVDRQDEGGSFPLATARSISPSRLKIDIINNRCDRIVLITLPYSRDWKVTSGNEQREVIAINAELLGVKITKNDKNIDIHYNADRYWGYCVSVFVGILYASTFFITYRGIGGRR